MSVAPFVPLVIVFLPQVVLATLQAKHYETSEASNNANYCKIARNELFHVTIACLSWWTLIHVERIEEHGCLANAAALIVFLKVLYELYAHLSLLLRKYFIKFIDLLLWYNFLVPCPDVIYTLLKAIIFFELQFFEELFLSSLARVHVYGLFRITIFIPLSLREILVYLVFNTIFDFVFNFFFYNFSSGISSSLESS